ncbi:hypothetical protein BJ875DRAFT_147788 [Amylocarpus encephaloides]|uniref:Nucleoporin NUP53 n=1 Tax=Amylocarpus encephaloides TaxID=45428 RepID=A0A9P7YT83_9HELO|nr:hypothetical protein BJ875DRAFT_147788 [Amylocarpus encephaloides]
MPPLILHNVPDEELYVGEDGIQRPYAMLFPGNENSPSISRARRTIPETGSFGKSTRRSRSRTGTPARKEDPTLEAANSIFSSFISTRASAAPESQRTNTLQTSSSQSNLLVSGPLAPVDGNSTIPSRYVHKEPTEVILRGFPSSHQYAAIREFERIGGRICEDYPRDPPADQRRYKSDLRDPATLRQHTLTAEEKVKALKFAGGEHWIKITFDSADGADAAVAASPQTIQGHLVYAELYRGVPPSADEPIPTVGMRSQTLGAAAGKEGVFTSARHTSTLPRSFTTPAMSQIGRGPIDISPASSHSSAQTHDTGTLSTATMSSGTVVGQPILTSDPPRDESSLVYCRIIPTAKRVQLLPAEQALLPQQSYSKRVMAQIPFLSWFTGDLIGSSVPRLDNGEFDYAKASLYWVFMYWLDRLLGGIFEVCTSDKGE